MHREVQKENLASLLSEWILSNWGCQNCRFNLS